MNRVFQTNCAPGTPSRRPGYSALVCGWVLHSTWLCTTLGLVALTASAAVHADSYRGPDTGGAPVDFSLRLQDLDTRLNYPGTTYVATVRQIGVTWEEILSPRLSGELLGGYEEMSQGGNPAFAGLAPSGYYAGIGLGGRLIDAMPFSVDLGVRYTYHNLSDDHSAQSLTVVWSQAQTHAVAALRLGGRLTAYAGAEYAVIDGEQRLAGSINTTLTFHEARRDGVFGGLAFNVDPGGRVGIELHGGQSRGGSVFFSRRF